MVHLLASIKRTFSLHIIHKTWNYYETLAFNCAKQALVCLNKVAICNRCNADKSMFPDIMDDTYPYLGLHTEHFQSYICEVSMLN